MLVRDNVRQSVAMLDVDADLGAGLAADEFAEAGRHAVAHLIRVSPPSFDPAGMLVRAEPGWLGLFVVDGLLIRRVTVGKRSACELFGPCDLLRPWDDDGEYAPLSVAVEWLVLKPTRMALLDTAFVRRTARWPTINSRIVARIAQRARYLTLIQTVTHVTRTDMRLLTIFWLLAERWGKVLPGGVFITIPLTHKVLAMLVGARRPTVTIALRRLADAGLLIREQPDRWLLTRSGIDALAQIDGLGTQRV